MNYICFYDYEKANFRPFIDCSGVFGVTAPVYRVVVVNKNGF